MKAKISVIIIGFLVLALFSGSMASASIPERMSGNYIGTFIGDDYGSLRLTVSPDGLITGIAHSNVSLEDLTV
ncbi:MAG: Uncharacterized protein XD80_0962, partial [Synergistales bacterium 53_16]